MQKYTVEMISRLQQIGITTEDAFQLRRIARVDPANYNCGVAVHK